MDYNIDLMHELRNRKILTRNHAKSFFLDELKRKSIELSFFYPRVDDENRLYDKQWHKKNCLIPPKKIQKGFVEFLKKTFFTSFEKIPYKWRSKIWNFFKGDQDYNPHRNIQEIRFTQTESIHLKNVACFGDIAITVNVHAIHKLEIKIENSFIFGTLNIYCVNQDIPYYAENVEEFFFEKATLHCRSSAIDQIKIRDSKFKTVDLDNVSLGLLSFQNNKIENFCLYKSNVESLKVEKSEISTKLFGENKINIEKCYSNQDFYKWNKIPPSYFNNHRCSKREGQTQISLDTTQFFYSNQSRFTRSELSKIDYQYGKIGMNLAQSFFYRCMGGMMNPFLIFTALVLAVVAFALMYYSFPGSFGPHSENGLFGPDCYFAFNEQKKFLYSLYFSAITLTTTGYGDLHPDENIMLIASTEGLVGILLGGTFLVALTRKYFEKK